MLHVLNTYINSLGKNLALTLVYNNANLMLGNIVHSSTFAVVIFVGCSLLNSAHSLDVYLTFLVDLYMRSQRNNLLFSKHL